jgi:membrane protease YdiL (CAAX protease family)
MLTGTQDRKRIIRNLTIFAVAVIVLGWLSLGVDALVGVTSPEESLSMLLWIVTPATISLLLRAFAGDGWKDLGIRPRFKGNGRWYAISILIYPVAVAIVLVLGLVFGATTVQDVSTSAADTIVQALIALLVKEIIVNILEEFAFRGYLAPKVYSLGLNVWLGHVIVGLVWGAWHLPVLRLIAPYTTESLWTLVPRFLIGAIAASLVYGEIRIRTDSVWPAVLMQTAGGIAVSLAMSFGLFSIRPSSGFLFHPVVEGTLMIVIFALVGIGLVTRREKHTSS